jgi:hypothetical protein
MLSLSLTTILRSLWLDHLLVRFQNIYAELSLTESLRSQRMEHSYDHYLAQRLDCVVRLVLLECKSVGSSLHRDLIVNAALSITG